MMTSWQPAEASCTACEPTARGAAAAGQAIEGLAGLQLLVVNGDAALRAILEGWLRELGVRAVFARSVAEALRIGTDCGPDLVLVDLAAGDAEHALKLARAARAMWGSAVVLLSDGGDGAARQTLGVIAAVDPSGVLCKPFHRQQLQLTLHLALRRLASAAAAAAAVGPAAGDLLSRFRPREQEVVRLLLEHHRVPAIARRLAISQRTVRNHLKGAFKRLGVHSQQELLERLHRAGSDGYGAPERPASDGRCQQAQGISQLSQAIA